MKAPTDILLPMTGRFRLRPIRVAEFSFLIFLLVVMGLPLLFLLSGSFNLRRAGQAGGLRLWQLGESVYRQRHVERAVDEFFALRRAARSGDDSFGDFRLADRAHRYARR